MGARSGGLLVAIEGVDGSGKGTQVAVVRQRAERLGLRVFVQAFPRYEHGVYGELCSRYLRGEFGSVGEVSPYVAALPYAGDRLEAAPLLRAERARCDLVLLDRYVGSNIAHQGAKLPVERLAEFAAWVERLEYEVHGIPRPDGTILLDMPAEVSEAMRERRGRTLGGAPDIHERDTGYLARVAECYRRLAASLPCWSAVTCSEAGAPRPPEAIADEIWRVLLEVGLIQLDPSEKPAPS